MNPSTKFLKIIRPIVIIFSILIALLLFLNFSVVFSFSELLGVFVILTAIVCWIWWASKKFIKVAEIGDKEKLTKTILLFIVVAFIVIFSLYQLQTVSRARIMDNPSILTDPLLRP
ncbi:MAG: hypothetical protein AAB415_01460 [Patescibacteria group bacterium]